MTLYYQITTPRPTLLKLENNQEMFVWQNRQWEASFFGGKCYKPLASQTIKRLANKKL